MSAFPARQPRRLLLLTDGGTIPCERECGGAGAEKRCLDLDRATERWTAHGLRFSAHECAGAGRRLEILSVVLASGGPPCLCSRSSPQPRELIVNAAILFPSGPARA